MPPLRVAICLLACLAACHFASAKKAKTTLPPLARSVNWTALGKVTSVKNLGRCGAPWAFAAAGALESAYLIVNDLNASTFNLDLSEQQMVNCVNKKTNKKYSLSQGCSGGDPYNALDYAYTTGILLESAMPYTATEAYCNTALIQSKSAVLLKAASKPGFVKPANNEEALKRAVMRQPIAIAMDVSDKAFRNYVSGIYTPSASACSPDTPNHIMLLVGYDTTGPTPFWIVKNSWDTAWGEQGYVRVKMTGDKKGPCGMYQSTAYPPLKFTGPLLKSAA